MSMFNPFIEEEIIEEVFDYYGYGDADPFLAFEEAVLAEEIVEDFLGF